MKTNRVQKGFISLTAILLGSIMLSAQQVTAKQPSLWENGVFLAMLCIIVLLSFIIAGMAEMVKGGASYQVKKSKNENGKKAAAFLLLITAASVANAQNVSLVVKFDYWGMGAILFWCLLSVIAFELIILYMLFRMGIMLLDVEERKAVKRAVSREEETPSFLEKFNASVAVADEEAIMFDHEYDGIRELDNNLPPWWKYGFYVTIVFAVLYLFHFHVLHTGKSSLEEYQSQLKAGEEQVAEYKKNAVNLVDETTAECLTDASSLAAGQQIFAQNCVACHGDQGQGKEGLGPNLCDDYWLHGGSIKDVFKSIKFGWTDKGMKSWEQDLKPLEILQVASFIKSLRGTNPPNPKEKQGEFYSEEGAVPKADSSAPKPVNDSAPKPAPDSAK